MYFPVRNNTKYNTNITSWLSVYRLFIILERSGFQKIHFVWRSSASVIFFLAYSGTNNPTLRPWIHGIAGHIGKASGIAAHGAGIILTENKKVSIVVSAKDEICPNGTFWRCDKNGVVMDLGVSFRESSFCRIAKRVGVSPCKRSKFGYKLHSREPMSADHKTNAVISKKISG